MATPLTALQQYFQSGATQSYAFRLLQLQRLKQLVLESEKALNTALFTDLKKSKEEVWATEIGFFLNELNYTIDHLKAWMQARSVATNILNQPSSSYTIPEPLGVVCIIGPWNYPFQLLFTPLIGAIAAGNCVVLKPSELAPATSAVMKQIIVSLFPENYIQLIEGDGAAVLTPLLTNFRFDHIFYTGSTAVGKIIYQHAANQLVPVTLELGGKSPALITPDANFKVAARRIASTKFSNAGQMCVAPDYVLVPTAFKAVFIKELIQAIEQFYGIDTAATEGYGKIINEKQWHRLVAYFKEGKIEYGGKSDAANLYIEPTILTGVALQSAVMQEEIFGPILPVLSYDSEEEALSIMRQHPNPLAFYVFTNNDSEANTWLSKVPSGGACINNASWHLTNHALPFGGRGFSGTGAYHGKASFDIFSHLKSVLKTPTWMDPDLKYPPYKGKLWLLKKLIG